LLKRKNTILGDFEPLGKEGEKIGFVLTFEFDLEGREKSRKTKFFCLGAIPENSESRESCFPKIRNVAG